MPLTDTLIRTAKPKAKSYKLPREDGLFVLVNPNGSKWWRLSYTFAGKEKLLSVGTYPEVSLKQARERRDAARRLLGEGIDPSEHRKAAKAADEEASGNTFKAVALEWLLKFAPSWSEGHGNRIKRRLEVDVFPWIGARSVGEITAPQLLSVVRRIEARGALETAHRALHNAGQVFRYAVATGRAERDPSGDLRGALPPVKEKHHASLTDPAAISDLLRAIDGYKGDLRCPPGTRVELHLSVDRPDLA